MSKMRACDVKEYFAKEFLFKKCLKNYFFRVIKAFDNTYSFERETLNINFKNHLIQRQISGVLYVFLLTLHLHTAKINIVKEV